MQIDHRIFGIGLNKTGTTTLKASLLKLGYFPAVPGGSRTSELAHALSEVLEHRNYEPALRVAERFRVFEDRPWNVDKMYRHLDQRFPNSRFILTTRAPESWADSVHRWLSVSKRTSHSIRNTYRQHFGVDPLDRDAMIEVFTKYEREVLAYFQDREDFLRIDFAAGHGWPELCTFLDVEVLQEDLPHRNRQTYGIGDIKKSLKRTWKRLKRRTRKKQRSERKLNLPPDAYCPICNVPRAQEKPVELETLKAALAPPTALPWKPDRLALIVACHGAAEATAVDNLRRTAPKDWTMVVVELAFTDQDFCLRNISDNLLQVRASSRLDHRPRMLNLGLDALTTDDFDGIVRLDWLGQRLPTTWAQDLTEALGEQDICQVPSLSSHHNRPIGWAARCTHKHTLESFDYAVAGAFDELLPAALSASTGPESAQHAVGSKYKTCKACKWPANPSADLGSAAHSWAMRVRTDLTEDCQQSLSPVSAANGDPWELLARHGFSPIQHLRENASGLWEWHNQSTALERIVRHRLYPTAQLSSQPCPPTQETAHE